MINYEAVKTKLSSFQEYYSKDIKSIYLSEDPSLACPRIVILFRNGDRVDLEPSYDKLEDSSHLLTYLNEMYDKYKETRAKATCPDTNALEKEDSLFDPVSRPSHYAEGREYEPKDVIYDWGLDFNLGCAVKYISRAGRKDDIIQDLEKAKQYIQFEIDAIQKKRDKEHA